MRQVLSILVAVVCDGALLSVACVAFSLQFSVTNYVNFAFGQYITFGALVGVSLATSLGFGLWFTLLGAGVAVAALSYVIGQGFYGPFHRRRPQVLYMLVLTFATATVLDSLYLLFWGENVYDLPFLRGYYTSGVFAISQVQVLSLVVAIVVIVLLQCFLVFTRSGRSMRAVADNPTLADIAGLRSRRVIGYTWALSGFIVGLAAVLQALQSRAFDTSLGDNLLYVIVAAVIVAGIGRPMAAVVGALIVTLAEQLAVYVVGSGVAPAGVFAVLVTLILVRPSGLLPGRTTLQNA